jgi:hypothetical protein
MLLYGTPFDEVFHRFSTPGGRRLLATRLSIICFLQNSHHNISDFTHHTQHKNSNHCFQRASQSFELSSSSRCTWPETLVNGLCYAAVPAGGIWDGQVTCSTVRNIIIAFATTTCCWFTYLKRNATHPLCLFMYVWCLIVCMNLYRWPYKDEVVVLPQFPVRY